MGTNVVNTADIVIRSRQLLQALANKDEAARDNAVARLTALARDSSKTEFRFQSVAGAPVASAPQMPEEKLVGALLDFETANVFLAAGQAADSAQKEDHHAVETGSMYLRQAVSSLEQTSLNLEAPPAFVLEYRDLIALNLNAPPPPPALPIQAPQLNTDAKTAVQTIIDESQRIVERLIEQAKKLDPSKMLQALQHLGSQVSGLAAAGQLIQQGIEKLKSAYQTLIDLIGSDALTKIKDKVGKTWEDIVNGKYSEQALAWFYDQKAIDDLADSVCQRQDLDKTVLGHADFEIADLVTRFKKYTQTFGIIIDVVGVSITILAFTPVREQGLLLAGAVYLTILGALLLIGANYAGSGKMLHWVKGIGEVVAGVVPTATMN